MRNLIIVLVLAFGNMSCRPFESDDDTTNAANNSYKLFKDCNSQCEECNEVCHNNPEDYCTNECTSGCNGEPFLLWTIEYNEYRCFF